MQAISRRRIMVLSAAGASAVGLPGCLTWAVVPTEPITGYAVDVHCHLFNATDLPVVRFLTEIVLRDHAKGPCTVTSKSHARAASDPIENPTAAERLIELFLRPLISFAPTAKTELDALRAGTASSSAGAETARTRELVARQVERFLDETGPNLRSANSADRRLRTQLLVEAGAGRAGLRSARVSNAAAARRLLAGDGANGLILKWIALFLQSRASLAAELAQATRKSGFKPALLVPLMVDYAHWLGQDTSEGSSFGEQVTVMGEIGKRAEGASIHGMVAFDPLRAVFWKRGRNDRFSSAAFDPIAMARDSMTNHGFLGLKVYPPMGFKATGNTDDQSYPSEVIRALPGGAAGLGSDLDDAMNQAFELCLEFDAPIIAHANNSVARGGGYGMRAAPAHWIKVLEKRPQLRVCLAHQGRFCWREDPLPAGVPASESSWEWTIGRYVRDNPDSHLYMDISYLSEVLEAGSARYYADQLKAWIRECDREARHIVYGTDWIMLGREQEVGTYGSRIARFLGKDCGLDKRRIERIMAGNALRFLGLNAGPTRTRILARYGERTPAWAALSVD